MISRMRLDEISRARGFSQRDKLSDCSPTVIFLLRRRGGEWTHWRIYKEWSIYEHHNTLHTRLRHPSWHRNDWQLSFPVCCRHSPLRPVLYESVKVPSHLIAYRIYTKCIGTEVSSKWNMYLKRTEYFDKGGKSQGNKYKLQFIYLIGGRGFF